PFILQGIKLINVAAVERIEQLHKPGIVCVLERGQNLMSQQLSKVVHPVPNDCRQADVEGSLCLLSTWHILQLSRQDLLVVLCMVAHQFVIIACKLIKPTVYRRHSIDVIQDLFTFFNQCL
ncbi:hypothetical protein EGW08_008446, partial [Elysia chlorotica]